MARYVPRHSTSNLPPFFLWRLVYRQLSCVVSGDWQRRLAMSFCCSTWWCNALLCGFWGSVATDWP
ncbi:hypothetical protein MUK42_07982 [Musa troglodytarum]|uniref:Uncharacterized protein n=1 Tax=Musa troglodytarum TaxID=320322 RepID=A0A9E7I3A7_9LILI|nr:hypothetical protein MUK42_07982 [Musa troglodytarum]URE41884.1 hypothetical protein MUK42_07982 [Musa troglodytarum]